MKAQDLMCDDFVRIKETGNIIQISCVDKTFDSISYFDREEDAELSPQIDKIEAIPITPEILEKYGFRFVSGGAWDYFYLKEIKWFDLFKKENGFALHIGQSEIYLNYLHELQHALKLCGIEKTIEL